MSIDKIKRLYLILLLLQQPNLILENEEIKYKEVQNHCHIRQKARSLVNIEKQLNSKIV